MNKGDTVMLTLDYKLNEQALTKDGYDEIELQLNAQTNRNSLKFLKSTGRIEWDETSSKFVIGLTQAETFKLKENSLNEDTDVEYQLRILLNGMVCSSDIGEFTIGPVLSRRVLEVPNE